MMLNEFWPSWSDLAIVFVLKCASDAYPMKYFEVMPFRMAMLHKSATGSLGTYLFQRFGLTTIPALFLLDRKGVVLCTDAC
jgi:hypothetical protein